jgi:8-oxo-dGTP diphosphatase
MHDNRHQWLQHPADSNWARYCPRCGGRLEERYIEDEQHTRKICAGCGFIFYMNPKVVAGAVPRQEDQIWLVRRNIEPSWGSWTFPGGYVDLGECVPDAAIRETYEETLLNVRLDSLLNVYSYPNVGIVLVVYRATVIEGVATATPESQEVRAFRLEDIPWEKLAFPSTRDALQDYVKFEKQAGRAAMMHLPAQQDAAE